MKKYAKNWTKLLSVSLLGAVLAGCSLSDLKPAAGFPQKENAQKEKQYIAPTEDFDFHNNPRIV